jgi:hypothetical protein
MVFGSNTVQVVYVFCHEADAPVPARFVEIVF